MNSRNRLNSHGCVRVNNFIDKQTISVFSHYFENKIRIGEWVAKENRTPGFSKFGYYADPLTEVFLGIAQSSVEFITNKELIPTYSYARVYQPGEFLTMHRDRGSCEITVTINVAYKGRASPIYTKYDANDPEEHILEPGDALIYLGCKTDHWRPYLEKDQLIVQFMLHYVDKNGPNVKYAKDNRPNYGFGSKTRSQ